MDKIIRHDSIVDRFGVRPKDEESCVAEVAIHDYGHVALIATFGSDNSIVDAAQVSYGKTLAKLATKERRTTLETRRLIRYLMRHWHTSPFEQADVAFYMRMPIFVARQIVRHRTAKLNEYSARYSELSDDFYVPGRRASGSHQLDGGLTGKCSPWISSALGTRRVA